MQKVMVIGCCGAGKSTFALQLRERTQLPLIHLDQVYWQAGWVEPSKAAFIQEVTALCQQDRWIIDGNYGSTLEQRLEQADTIIFLDRTRWVCLYRVVKRILQNYGKTRTDMAPGCRERFNWEFLKYVYRFRDEKRPGIMEKLKRYQNQKNIILLDSDQAVQRFFRQLET
jgi:adenylate kinase family enzyme